jgi:uncharacterized protein YigE (DUF2233 family)
MASVKKLVRPAAGRFPTRVRKGSRALARLLAIGLFLPGGVGFGAEAFTVEHQGGNFDVYRLAPGEEQRLQFFWQRPDGGAYGSISALRQHLASRGEELVFAVNGGIYSRELEPLGLYVEGGERLTALSRGRGGGNFFLKPNGVFYVTADGARVVTSDAYQPRRPVLNAVQSGPMLVIDGELHPRFIPGYHSRHVRNGVGVDRAGQVVFAISEAPVNFHDFGTLFRDRLDCRNALYLDGKISQMYLPELGRHALWAWKPMVSIIGLTDGSTPAVEP